MSQPDWIEEARLIAAQCWCDDETKDIEMDAPLAEAFAKRIAAWMSTAAQNQQNADFWQGKAEGQSELVEVPCSGPVDAAVYQDAKADYCDDLENPPEYSDMRDTLRGAFDALIALTEKGPLYRLYQP
jgi:hypothetical protein